MQVPARAAFSVTLTPRTGDPDLYVYDGRATALGRRCRIVGRSLRGSERTDRVSIVNRARRAARLPRRQAGG